MTMSRWPERWPEARTLEFVRMYRQHECLWNPHSKLYKNREARDAACRAMVAVSNNPSFTVSDVKHKIKNLRSTFLQELKKIRASRNGGGLGGGGGKQYKPAIIWFDDMKPIMRVVASDLDEDSIVAAAAADEDSEQTLTGEDQFEEITFEFHQIDNEGDWRMKTEDETNSVVMAEPPPLAPVSHLHPHHQPLGGSVWTQLDDNMTHQQNHAIRNSKDIKTSPGGRRGQKSAAVYSNQPSNTTAAAAVIEDEFYYFGLNVACQLRKLPLKTSLQLQLAVQRMLAKERIAQNKRLARRNRRRLVTTPNSTLPLSTSAVNSSASTEDLLETSSYLDLQLEQRLLENSADTC